MTDIDTNSSDYGDYVAAVQAAIDAYTGDGTVTFDGTTVTFTATDDGDVMTPLTFEFGLVDDVLIEGPEDFAVGLTNATSPTGAAVTVASGAASATTTINDTQGDGGDPEEAGQWAISGPSDADEGSTPQYTVSLSGMYGDGEVVTVDLGLTDNGTNSSDYGDLLAAIEDAADANPNVTFDPTTGTLTYTSPSDGASMTDLLIDLPITDDGLIEGPEAFTLELENATTTTGAAIEVDPAAASISTTINDTRGVGGDPDGPSQWSITGSANGDEGTDASYTVSLSGAFGAGEDASVDISLTDTDTNSDDYADYVAAVQEAVDAYAGPGTVELVGTTITFTAGSDGDVMTPLEIALPLIDDALIEGPEDFAVGLSNAGSSTGAAVELDSAATSVATTINDTQGPGGDTDGPAEWSITGAADADEGSNANFEIVLAGLFGAGENVSVDVSLGNIDTNADDYGSYITAVQSAVDAYAGPGTVVLAGNTITFTAGADGDEMTPLNVELPLVDDGLTEGPEDFVVGLVNAGSTSGADVAIDPAAGSAVTTINDTEGADGGPDDATWSIEGSDSVQEGGIASYRVALDGTLQAGEVVSVELGLNDIDTDSSDHSTLIAAIEAAVAGRPDLTFDPTTGQLTFTAPANGEMEELVFSVAANVDGVVEPNETFEVTLSNPGSTTGADVAIDSVMPSVTSTIVSTDLASSAIDPNNNVPPIASDDTAQTFAGQPVTGNLFSNDGDPEGGVITLVDPTTGVAATGPVTLTTEQGGSVTIDPVTGEFTYTPPVGFEGFDEFDYEIIDPNGNTSSANVSLSVIPDQDPSANNEPDANDDAVVTQLNTPTNGNVLDNDSDLNSDPIVITEVNGIPVVAGTPAVITTPNGGTLEISDDGTFAYTPGDDFTGTETVTYTIDDGMGGTDTATISLSVFDLAPEPQDDVNATSANLPVVGNVLVNDSSDPNDVLTVTEVNGTPIGNGGIPTNCGIVEMNADGTYTFTPLPDMAGTDTFTYTVVDENGNTSQATVTIDIADIGVAKSIAASPTLLANGNYSVTYQVVVQNLGVLDLGSVSLQEDLATQLGAAFESAGGLTITSPTSNANSSIIVDSNWNGGSVTEMLASGSTLASGDQFKIEFTVELDVMEFASGADASNSVIANGVAIDSNGNVTNFSGDLVVVNDLSDSGTDPNGNNIGEPGDTFGSDDATLLQLPSVGIAKSAADAVANGDNFDVTFTLYFENNGTTAVSNLNIVDDVIAGLGDAFVSVSNVTIQNFNGTGVAPAVNGAWASDTSQTMVVGGTAEVGDTFEVTYTVTIDPDASGTASAMSNQATVGGTALDERGNVLTDASGQPTTVSDDSDSGINPNDENGEEVTQDGIYANDPTSILIADLGIAKSLVGEPVLTDLGNYVVTYQLVVENTGTVDLANISLLEDLETQFGSALVDAGNLNLVSGPSDSRSSIAIDSANWNGTTSIEIMDAVANNLLTTGDSFTVEFDIEINPREIEETVGNQVIGSAAAVDTNGDPILDSNGEPIVGTDLSDSGTDPSSNNSSDTDDQGTSEDTTLFDPPEVPLSEISGTVFQDDNGDGGQQPGESGIAGVEITLTGTDVLGNEVEVIVFTDANGRYTFDGLNAGTYAIAQTQPDGFTDGEENGNAAWTIGNDRMSNIALGWGETFGTSTFAERLPGASGNPPRLPGLPPIVNNLLSNTLGNYGVSSSTIYSGTPINSNGNPISLDSGRPVTGGYFTENYSSWFEIAPQEKGYDCEKVIVDNSDCGPGTPQERILTESSSMNLEAEIGSSIVSEVLEPAREIRLDGSCADQMQEEQPIDCESSQTHLMRKPSFLKRFIDWIKSGGPTG